jgi:hypothetical protein
MPPRLDVGDGCLLATPKRDGAVPSFIPSQGLKAALSDWHTSLKLSNCLPSVEILIVVYLVNSARGV